MLPGRLSGRLGWELLLPGLGAGGQRALAERGARVTAHLFFIMPCLYTARLARIWEQLGIFVF